MKKVLIIDSNRESSLELERLLTDENHAPVIDDYVDCCIKCEIQPVGRYTPVSVDTVDAGLAKIQTSKDLKVVLLNVALSERKGLAALKKIKREHPEVIVIVSGAGAKTAGEAVYLGALDAAFIVKPTIRYTL